MYKNITDRKSLTNRYFDTTLSRSLKNLRPWFTLPNLDTVVFTCEKHSCFLWNFGKHLEERKILKKIIKIENLSQFKPKITHGKSLLVNFPRLIINFRSRGLFKFNWLYRMWLHPFIPLPAIWWFPVCWNWSPRMKQYQLPSVLRLEIRGI